MSYFAEYAWLPGGLARHVTIEIAESHFSRVEPDTVASTDATSLAGLVLPGFANVHSHAFHRALRGRTQSGRGSFWTWRSQMYALAERLDPDSYLALARATYAEMALAGVTAVGEFHYLHHGQGGRPYADPNAMGAALVEAARQAGVRLTLLDTCYLAGGLGGGGPEPLSKTQRRFSDGDVEHWAKRVDAIEAAPHLIVGAAVHSVRAVPRRALASIVEAATGRPLHVHLSEQPAENEACLAAYGLTPSALLDAEGVLGPATTAVHATHLRTEDVDLLGRSGTGVCICPTTERDLADGIGPARALRDAGSPLSLGSDQHAVIDLLEEARALEMDDRLASGERGRFETSELLAALTTAGHEQLGWHGGGRLAAGAPADLVAVKLDSPRTAGTTPSEAHYAATAADVNTVVVGGRVVVSGGRHLLGDVGAQLGPAIDRLWDAL
jgi:formiminoglutamate deiminase